MVLDQEMIQQGPDSLLHPPAGEGRQRRRHHHPKAVQPDSARALYGCRGHGAHDGHGTHVRHGSGHAHGARALHAHEHLGPRGRRRGPRATFGRWHARGARPPMPMST